MRRLSGTDTLMLYAENAKAQNIIAPVAVYDASTAPGGRVTLRLKLTKKGRQALAKHPRKLKTTVVASADGAFRFNFAGDAASALVASAQDYVDVQ